MFSILKPALFKLDPETAHDFAIKSLKFNPLPKNLVSENGIIDTMSGTTIEEKIKCLV